jgi:hypothetical protein
MKYLRPIFEANDFEKIESEIKDVLKELEESWFDINVSNFTNYISRKSHPTRQESSIRVDIFKSTPFAYVDIQDYINTLIDVMKYFDYDLVNYCGYITSKVTDSPLSIPVEGREHMIIKPKIEIYFSVGQSKYKFWILFKR